MKQAGEHVDPPLLYFRRLWVLIVVNVVLVKALCDKLIGFWLHPRGNKAGEIEGGVAVQVQLIVN